MFRITKDPSSGSDNLYFDWNYLICLLTPTTHMINICEPLQESFTCRKSTTCNRRLYFPSEGRRAGDFFALKNPTASAANPRTWVPKASTLPLDHRSRLLPPYLSACFLLTYFKINSRNLTVGSHTAVRSRSYTRIANILIQVFHILPHFEKFFTSTA